jgi:hypothetical protein
MENGARKHSLARVVGLWLTDAGATESLHRSPATVVKAELVIRKKFLQLAQHIEGDDQ